jgi:uncharacterized protein YjaZ
MKKILFIILFTFSLSVFCQTKNNKISTIDVDNFWVAYDSVLRTSDKDLQVKIIQQLYLDKASDGLKDFIELRSHTSIKHLENIQKYPKFWTTVRSKTLEIKSYVQQMEKIMVRFKKLYPEFKQPDIYFTIGVLNSGGTTSKDKILIGSEIACSDSTIDATELGAWLRSVFKDQKNVLSMVAHEVGHTQQKDGDSEDDGGSNLLGYCIREGACDFISELLLKKPVLSPYMTYGVAHEKELWIMFTKEMRSQKTENWLYNGRNAPNGNADLGYFIGYEICKSYYNNSKDKKQALKEIIELEYTKESVEIFLVKSEYAEKWK